MSIKETSPIKEEEIPCPYCKVPQKQVSLRSNWYFAEKRDRDTHVIKYKWIDEQYQYLNPLHYAIWTCNSCGFSDFLEKYVKFAFNSNLEYNLKETFTEIITEKPELIERLMSKYLETSSSNIKSVYQLYILIYVTEQSDHTLLIKEDLAKLYLRLAWLYREMKSGDNEEYEEKDLMKDAFIDEFDAHASQFNAFRQNYLLFKNNLDKKFIQKLDASDVDVHIINNYFDQYKDKIESLIDEMENESKTLYRNILENCLNSDVENQADEVEIDLDFLRDAKKLWSGMLMSEMNALLKCNSYFMDLINNGFYDEGLKIKLKVFEIIAINYYRINYFNKTSAFLEKALKLLSEQYVASMSKIDLYSKNLEEIKTKISRMKKPVNTNSVLHEEKKKLEVQIQLNQGDLKLIKEYANLFKRMKSKSLNNEHDIQLKKARVLLSKYDSRDYKQKIVLLRENGFNEKLIEELVPESE